MAVPVKDAIQAARVHLLELMPDASAVRLEEVEREGHNWAITFSINSSTFGGGPFGFGRVAKVICVDENGDFVSLKQRAA
jgi:hypothetical protein